MKQLFFLGLITGLCITAEAQNVGVNVPIPVENLHVDSVIKVGKSIALNSALRKNLIKFGDGNYVSIGEETVDDKMYIRFGDLSFMKSTSSIGSGYIGINTETPSAHLDLNGSFRLRANGAAAGKVLTSDANGLASWENVAGLTLPYSGTLSSGSTHAFRVINATSGLSAGYFENSGTSNATAALQGINKAVGTFGTGIFGQANAGANMVTYGVWGVLSGTGNSGYGVFGESQNANGIGGESQTGNGVTGIARSTGGIGGYFAGFTGANALRTYGNIQLTGIGEGSGKILTSDGSGRATWAEPGNSKALLEYGLEGNLPVPGNGNVVPINFDDQISRVGFTTTFSGGTTKFIAPSDGYYQITIAFTMAFVGTVTGDSYLRFIYNPTGSANQVLRGSHYFLPNTSGRKTSETFSKLIYLSQGDKFWFEVVFNGNSSLAIYGDPGSSDPGTTLSCIKVFND